VTLTNIFKVGSPAVPVTGPATDVDVGACRFTELRSSMLLVVGSNLLWRRLTEEGFAGSCRTWMRKAEE